MPELRKDPITGQWVIIATERARRPGTIITQQKPTDHDGNGFINEIESLEDIYVIPKDHQNGDPQWSVRVVPSPHRILKIEEEYERRGHGIYDVVNGYGAHELVIETPDSITNMADLEVQQIRHVIQAYVARLRDLSQDKYLKYTMITKSYQGQGSRGLGPSHSEIISAPVIPLRVKEKLKGAKRYYDFHERSVFSDLIRQELADRNRIIAETEHYVVLTPFASRFPFEMWVLPKQLHCDFMEGVSGTEEDLASVLKDVLLRVKEGLDDPSYSMVLYSAPFRHSHQPLHWKTLSEDYSWHIEIVPQLTHVAGFEKGTGFFINSIPPENTTEYVREIACC